MWALIVSRLCLTLVKGVGTDLRGSFPLSMIRCQICQQAGGLYGRASESLYLTVVRVGEAVD